MKNLQVGTKVEAYTGRCVGLLIQSTTWQGEIIKVNKKSIQVNLTDSVSKFGGKITSQHTMLSKVTYCFWKALDDGREIYRSKGNIYGKITL